MLELDGKNILCSRGDSGTIGYKQILTDEHKYLQFKDDQENVYWYDTVNNILYDSDYNKSDVNIKTLTPSFVKFKANDEIRFNVYEKKGMNKTPVLSKLVTVSEETEKVNIDLTEEDTTIGPILNKETYYWYDISLNESHTTVGYDKDGAKIFTLFPAIGKGENDGQQ